LKTVSRDISQEDFAALTPNERLCFQFWVYFNQFFEDEQVPIDDPVVYLLLREARK